MLSLFEIAALLLVLSAVLSWLNRAYIKLPHTIGLLVMALLASFAIIDEGDARLLAICGGAPC